MSISCAGANSFLGGVVQYTKDLSSVSRGDMECIRNPLAVMHACLQLHKFSKSVSFKPISYILYTLIAANVTRFVLHHGFFNINWEKLYVCSPQDSLRESLYKYLKEARSNVSGCSSRSYWYPSYQEILKTPNKSSSNNKAWFPIPYIFWMAERTSLAIRIGNIFNAFSNLKENKLWALAYLTTAVTNYDNEETPYVLKLITRGIIASGCLRQHEEKLVSFDLAHFANIRNIASHCFNSLKMNCNLSTLKKVASLQSLASFYEIYRIFNGDLFKDHILSAWDWATTRNRNFEED